MFDGSGSVVAYMIKLTGWEAYQVSKGMNKAALFYVEQTVIVHIVLFYV